MVERLDDDVSYDKVIYHLSVMKDVEIGLDQVARGEVIDDEELLEESFGEDEAEKAALVGSGRTKAGGNRTVHRRRKRSPNR
jgi:hypothetical protein